MLHIIHINILLFMLGLLPGSVPGDHTTDPDATTVQVIDSVEKDAVDNTTAPCNGFPDCSDVNE